MTSIQSRDLTVCEVVGNRKATSDPVRDAKIVVSFMRQCCWSDEEGCSVDTVLAGIIKFITNKQHMPLRTASSPGGLKSNRRVPPLGLSLHLYIGYMSCNIWADPKRMYVTSSFYTSPLMGILLICIWFSSKINTLGVFAGQCKTWKYTTYSPLRDLHKVSKK